MTPVNTIHRGPKAVSARPVPAFSFELTPLSYARLVHPSGGAGVVAFCGSDETTTGKRFWLDRRWSPYALATRETDLRKFRFMSFATWPRQGLGDPKPKRTEANAVGIGASWLDLDFYKLDAWKGVPPATVLEVVRNRCEDLGIPAPSYATHSGRGLLVAWLYPTVPAQAVLPRHRAIQETLHQAFLGLGNDRSAKSITKVFRMPGTRNERSGLPVTVIWPIHTRDITTTTFEEMAATVLPHRRKSRAEKEAEAAAAAAKAERAANRKPRKARETHAGATLGGRSYWGTLREDLERLYKLRHGAGPVEDGKGRNDWILALSYAAAWDMPASELDGYVKDQAARCGLTEQEALDKTVTVRSKAKASARGEKTVRDGRSYDSRYRPSPRYFRDDLLDITPLEAKRANLRMLVTATRRAELAAGRVEKSRRAKGVKARSTQQTHRREIGHQAVEFMAEGMTVTALAELYGVSPRWISNALRDARADLAIVEAKPAPAPVSESPAIVTVDDIADTLDVETFATLPATHEVLRGTNARAREAVVASSRTQYVSWVTTAGCTSSRQAPVARLTPRRASLCSAPASEMEVA